MKFVSRYLWIVCVLAGFFMLAETLKATLPQTVVGSWISASLLSQARANAASVLLPDGRILILGGDGASGPQQSIEVFATDGAVSPAAPMGVPRSHHFAVALSDGRDELSSCERQRSPAARWASADCRRRQLWRARQHAGSL